MIITVILKQGDSICYFTFECGFCSPNISNLSFDDANITGHPFTQCNVIALNKM